ncbi:MAG: hypothetical protein KBT35_01555, partial [Firmicutes bacterium]|nr:hypothetical protein [Candidatus Colivicinus equi]
MSYNKTKYLDSDYPHLLKYIVNECDYHCTKTCKKYINVKCIGCGKIYQRRVVDFVKAGHVTCPLCCDGFSYPEKLMSNILNSIEVDFIYQFEPDWLTPFKYDFFIKPNIIIEMDGGMGHGYNNTTDNIDIYKDSIASKYGMKIIRIDCNYKNDRFEYIKKSIISSVGDLLDLSCIDWNECNIKSLESKMIETIDCYRNVSKYVS